MEFVYSGGEDSCTDEHLHFQFCQTLILDYFFFTYTKGWLAWDLNLMFSYISFHVVSHL